MNAPDGVNEDQIRTYLQGNVDADLIHLLQENGVPLGLQYNLTQQFKTVRRFGALADTRADVRNAVQQDVGLNPDNLERRSAMAAVVATWEAARDYATKENELRAEAKILGIPRPVTQTDKAAMKTSFVVAHGAIEEQHEPSDDYLSAKMEEIESHEPTASLLSEVTSKKTARTQAIQTTVDAGGSLRIVKKRTQGKLPQGTEELRTILRVEGNLWCYLSAKYRNRSFLQGMDTRVWADYTNYLLGEKCYMMKVPSAGSTGPEDQVALRPPWSVIIRYEHEIRKDAVKVANSTGRPLIETLKEAWRNSELKEQYFTAPIALQGRSNLEGALPFKRRNEDNDTRWSPYQRQWTWEKGAPKGGKDKSKGKGKGKDKQGGKDKNEHGLVSTTPDGRQICFAFNSQGCDDSCGRVHICRVRNCGKSHPMWQHYAEAHAANAAKKN